ncbi:hypothetical protein K8R42_01795, partial [bacterium]|nr:hypothetical protein [bacterium]
RNISAEPIIVFISPDDFVENIIIQPSEIKLLPDEITQLKIQVYFPEEASGIKNTHISVVSRAIDKKSFNAASGIKIPLTVNITKEYFQWSGPVIFVVVFGGLLLLALLVQSIFELTKHKKKRRRWPDVNFLHHRRKFPWLKR